MEETILFSSGLFVFMHLITKILTENLCFYSQFLCAKEENVLGFRADSALLRQNLQIVYQMTASPVFRATFNILYCELVLSEIF